MSFACGGWRRRASSRRSIAITQRRARGRIARLRLTRIDSRARGPEATRIESTRRADAGKEKRHKDPSLRR
jgi:hypothetical protein